MNCSCIAVISKRLKKSLFNSRVLKCHDFRELIGFISLCNIQLFLCQIKTLFRKKLRGDAVCPFRPVCFFTGLIYERQLLGSVLVCVIALTTTLFHKRTKRIGRIILYRFQNLLHRRTDRFVGIKPNIYALWKIVRVDSHTFEVVRAIYHDANLRVVGITQRQISCASAKFDKTIFLFTAILCIIDLKTFGIQTCRILECRFEGITTVIGLVILQRINLIILKDFFMFCTRRTKNLQVCLLTRIRCLWNTTTIYFIAFHLKNIKCLIHAFL